MAAMIGLGIEWGKVCGRRSAGCLRVDVQLAVAERLQFLHVRARTEAAAGARHDDHAHLLRLPALLEHPEVDALHLRGPRVQAIGPVERQQRHTVLDPICTTSLTSAPPARCPPAPASLQVEASSTLALVCASPARLR